MKKQLCNPLYLSVTATPQAVVFLDEYSQLRPDSIRLIEPGNGYCGADVYHLFDSTYLGDSFVIIDYHGWLSKVFLNYWGIDTEGENKGIYKNCPLPEVVDKLYKSTNIAHIRIAKSLKEKYL